MMTNTSVAPTLPANEDLPALFQSADKASLAAQRHSLILMFFQLLVLVSGAAFSALSVTSQSARMTMASIGGILFGGGIILTAAIQIHRPERSWYGCRAIAESAKTLAWRYMTATEPYGFHLSPPAATAKFTEALRLLLAERKHLLSEVGAGPTTGREITERMRQIRALDVRHRKTAYVEGRVNQERSWYATKAENCQKVEKRLFIAIYACQFCALIFSLWLIAHPNSNINLLGLFSSLAACCWTWMQLKQYQELAQSYGLAARELGLIVERAEHIRTNDDLSKFVTDAEGAISREHTLWIARRAN